MVRHRALGRKYLLKNKDQSSLPTSWEKLKDFHLRLFLPLTDGWIYKSKESTKKIMKELLIYIFQNNVNYSRNWILKNKERSELVFFMDPQNIIVDPQFVVFCLWTPVENHCSTVMNRLHESVIWPMLPLLDFNFPDFYINFPQNS